MRSAESITRSNRMCGRFFVFLAVFSAALSCVHFCFGRWGLGLLALPCVLFFGSIGWLVLSGTVRIPGGGGSRGMPEAGKPVPLRPTPTHHLVAAKDLPPSDKTHSLPRD